MRIGMLVWLAAVLAMGCQTTRRDSGTDAAVTGGDAAVMHETERELTISGMEWHSYLEPPAAEGTIYLSVDVTLTNHADAPAPLASSTFGLETASGLLIGASPATASLESGVCPNDAFLVSGASRSCSVVFALPYRDVPAAVVYLGEPGGRADFSAETPQAAAARLCEITSVTYFDESDCGRCVYGRVFSSDICPTELGAARATCGDTNIGDCDALSSASTECAAAAAAYGECLWNQCSDRC